MSAIVQYWPVRYCLGAAFAAALAACAPQAAPQSAEPDRFLVYFEEVSANISPDALHTIAEAARRAGATNARRIRVEARASATGTFELNKKLAETRGSVVADALEHDGIARAMIQQVPIGQTASSDPTLNERRVDIVLEH